MANRLRYAKVQDCQQHVRRVGERWKNGCLLEGLKEVWCNRAEDYFKNTSAESPQNNKASGGLRLLHSTVFILRGVATILSW